MAENYTEGAKIEIPGVVGILEGISINGIDVIDVMDDNGKSSFYPISDLEGVSIEEYETEGGMTYLSVRVMKEARLKKFN